MANWQLVQFLITYGTHIDAETGVYNYFATGKVL